MSSRWRGLRESTALRSRSATNGSYLKVNNKHGSSLTENTCALVDSGVVTRELQSPTSPTFHTDHPDDVLSQAERAEDPNQTQTHCGN